MNGKISSSFNISRGTKQGSILSPLLFNIFIDEILQELKLCNEGVRIGRDLYNAYADDVTIMAASVPGLHKLISVCQDYSKKWRLTFGIKKTRCITIGSYRLCDKQVWLLDGKNIECVKSGYIGHKF